MMLRRRKQCKSFRLIDRFVFTSMSNVLVGIVTVGQKGSDETGRMKPPPDPHYRRRYRAGINSYAVWLYHVFSLSLRDVELLLAERGVVVSYESIRRWCAKFGSGFANSLRRRQSRPGDKWHLDEVFIRIQGELHYLWFCCKFWGGRTRWAWSEFQAATRNRLVTKAACFLISRPPMFRTCPLRTIAS
jgi:hypothetical protein